MWQPSRPRRQRSADNAPVGGPHEADGLGSADACGARVACGPKPAHKGSAPDQRVMQRTAEWKGANGCSGSTCQCRRGRHGRGGTATGRTKTLPPTALQLSSARTSGSVGRLHRGARAGAKVCGQKQQASLIARPTAAAQLKPCCSNSRQPLAHLRNSAGRAAPVVRARMPAYVVPLTVLPRMCCTKRTSLDTTAQGV